MIGGTDVILPNPGMRPAAILDLAVRSIFSRWPDAKAQDVSSGEQFSSFSTIPFSTLQELFVYQSFEALESWERLGADPSNLNSMLHLIADEKELTMVVDDASDTSMKQLLEEVKNFIDHYSGYLTREVA
jgi:hypothetical protein